MFVKHLIAVMIIFCSSVSAEEVVTGELIFPLESWHNHGSAIIECPNGDMLVCWFHGSGERKADDVEILGARWVKKTGKWTEPFQLADTPEFPDTNCTMIIDQNDTLWLLWPVIQANLWESALMKVKKSTNYMMDEGAPEWDVMTIMHVKHPGDFPTIVKEKMDDYVASTGREVKGRTKVYIDHVNRQAKDKLTRRLGWFTRAHPLILEDGRMLVGLYSDGFSFSLVGITDDLGKTWQYSEPIVGGGNIQPSFATKKDGTIVAYMRDNGPAPKRVHVSESTDRGMTWSTVYDHAEMYNPGSGLEVMTMSDGDWVCIYNDHQSGRHSLAVSLSEDEGKTWKYTRHVELWKQGHGQFHYPSIIEGSDGNLHVSYSYFVEIDQPTEKKGKSIKYATFSKDWIKGL